MQSPRSQFSFLDEVANRCPALAREEEVKLARRVRDFDDKAAAEVLARAHLRNVIATAARHRHYGVPVAELVAEGNCGLVDALRKFDPERGVRFGTYANYWIRAYVLAYVIRSSSLLGGPTGLIRSHLFFKVRRERGRMLALFGDGPATDQALAERLGISLERLHSLLERLDCRELSLDVPRGQEQGRFADSLACADSPEQCYFEDECTGVASAAVSAALLDLDPRERFIAERRLMASPDEELSLAEIARSMGISRERVRQLETRTKHKLKRSMAIRGNPRLTECFSDWIPELAAAG